jgi:succinate-semialdehyde dehydrogenase / glutarate-semialdehyde dehydrogenase
VQALIVDTGRVAIARLEVQAVVGMARRLAALADSISLNSKGRSAFPNIEFETQNVPYSLVGVISPWNFPFLLAMIDALPAFLAGSAVWVKPSEVTPRFVAPLMQIINQLPLLSDLIRFCIGDGQTGEQMIARSDAICFTGSVTTGRKVYLACAHTFIPAFLELGGKDPLIVLPDADLELASSIALRGSVIATGQACQSIERIYIDQERAEEFIRILTIKAQAQRLSTTLGVGEIGPLIFFKQAEVLRAQLADAKAKGAVLRCGGEIETHGGGLWLRPTVLSNVNHSMSVMTEESFGPILPVMAYASLEQAITLANDSEFGLSAAVIGPLTQAKAVAAQLQVGGVSINDSALTSMVHDVEKQAFKLSGLGASRMGLAGVSRFWRKRSLLIQTGAALPLEMLHETAP